jgi:hypothetical protein
MTSYPEKAHAKKVVSREGAENAEGCRGIADSRILPDHLAQPPPKMLRRAGQQSVPAPVSARSPRVSREARPENVDHRA